MISNGYCILITVFVFVTENMFSKWVTSISKENIHRETLAPFFPHGDSFNIHFSDVENINVFRIRFYKGTATCIGP